MQRLAVNQLMIKGAPAEPVEITAKGVVIGTFYPLGANAPERTAEKGSGAVTLAPACTGHLQRIAELEAVVGSIGARATQLHAALDRGYTPGGRAYSKAQQTGRTAK